jgi:nitroreductase/NAD-dependent dihydropyrimidine dehydrogenase PreA subunit
MNMISITADQCNVCGVCVERCINNYHKDGEEISVTATPETCSLCGHCVALCPTDAIEHHKMDMGNFTVLDRKLKFDPGQFDEFVRARRSVRSFKQRKVSHDQLASLVDLCRYAPTGSNKQDVQILVIEDKKRIAAISKLTEKCVTEVYPQWSERSEELKAARPDPIFYRAPALMIFHQPKASGKTDSVIAAQTVVLSAMTHGLGTCYIGFLEHAWHSSAEVREIVDLPADNAIASVLILGYPKLKYLRAVDRHPMKVRWE